MDIAVHDVVEDFTRGDLAAGKLTYDLASRGVDLSYSGGYITDLRRQIDDARKQIVDGTVIVPCFPTERVAEARDVAVPLPDDHCWR